MSLGVECMKFDAGDHMMGAEICGYGGSQMLEMDLGQRGQAR